MQPEYVVVTGAAGFIGSNLAHLLASEGYPLLLVDHPLTRLKSENLIGLRSFDFVEHDLFLERLYTHTLKRAPSAIFHLGACSSTTNLDLDYLQRNNVEYTQRLWEWAVKRGCPFLYASSAATYGDGSQGFDDEIPPERLLPLNPYGHSKNQFDRWALKEMESGRTPPVWAGVKFFNVYGPREQHKGSMASVVYKAYRQIREHGLVVLYKSNTEAIEDGKQRRDFVYVEDCLQHLLWLWRRPHPNGLFNSGTGTARTFLDLVHAVFSALHVQPNIRFVEMPESIRSRYQNFTEASLSKLRRCGCDVKVTPLEEGVRRYVAFLEAHG